MNIIEIVRNFSYGFNGIEGAVGRVNCLAFKIMRMQMFTRYYIPTGKIFWIPS